MSVKSVSQNASGVFILFCFVLPVFIGITNFTSRTRIGVRLVSNTSLEKGSSSGLLIPDGEWRSLRELGSFDRQAAALSRRARLSRAAARGLATVQRAVTLQLTKLWTDIQLTPFGSAVNGLGLSTSSDIDIYVTLPRTNADTSDNTIELILESAEMLKQNNSFTKITPLYNPSVSSVPILRFLFTPTNQWCDLCFQKYDEGDTTLLKYMFRLDNRALNLMIIIKLWAKIHKLQVSYFMPSIVWYKLVVFYLQQVQILPPVYELQGRDKMTMVKNWNTAFEESYVYLYPSENTDSLYDIVGGFFEYYSNFNFERDCVSVFAGKPVARKLFVSAETVPEEFALYTDNLRNNISEHMRIDTPICVQRAFLHNDNIGRRVSPALLEKVKTNLFIAADLYRTKDERYFLSAILTDYK